MSHDPDPPAPADEPVPRREYEPPVAEDLGADPVETAPGGAVGTLK
jgi:hypothetical protein